MKLIPSGTCGVLSAAPQPPLTSFWGAPRESNKRLDFEPSHPATVPNHSYAPPPPHPLPPPLTVPWLPPRKPSHPGHLFDSCLLYCPRPEYSGVPKEVGCVIPKVAVPGDWSPTGKQAKVSLTQAAEAVALAAEEESRQRQSLAGGYATSLGRQLELLHQDLCARQDQWASFCSALMETQWLLKAPANSSPGKFPRPGQSPEEYVPD